MLQERGIQGVRVLQGVRRLTERHPGTSIEKACEIAHTHGAHRLRFNPSIKKKQVYDPATRRFIREVRDVSILGPPGTGKSFLVQGLGYQAIKAGFTVLYRSIFDMVRDEPSSGSPKLGRPAIRYSGDRRGISPRVRPTGKRRPTYAAPPSSAMRG